MASDDLDAALEAARAAREAAEAEAARKRAEDVSRHATQEELRDAVRQQLREVGTTFVERARRLGIKPEKQQVVVGSRPRRAGIFESKKERQWRASEGGWANTTLLYEQHRVWTVLHPEPKTETAPMRNGIYVLEDGRIIGGLWDVKSMPHVTVEAVTQRLAEYLLARE